MAYTTVPALSDNDEVTHTWWNTYVRANFAAIFAQYAAKGDMAVATAADTGAAHSVGSDTQVIEADSGQASGIKESWCFVPIGGIIMWNAALGGLPANWQICDGTNGTPDLRNKFVIGAGSTYSVGGTGGANTANLEHNHSGSVTDSDGGHTHTQADTGAGGAHQHTYTTGVESATASGDDNAFDEYGALPNHTHVITTDTESAHIHNNPDTNTGGAHTHGVTLDNQLSSSQDIRPPYYAIYYIMRLS